VNVQGMIFNGKYELLKSRNQYLDQTTMNQPWGALAGREKGTVLKSLPNSSVPISILH